MIVVEQKPENLLTKSDQTISYCNWCGFVVRLVSYQICLAHTQIETQPTLQSNTCRLFLRSRTRWDAIYGHWRCGVSVKRRYKPGPYDRHKWAYNQFEWPFKWVINRVYDPTLRYRSSFTPFIAGGGPPCSIRYLLASTLGSAPLDFGKLPASKHDVFRNLVDGSVLYWIYPVWSYPGHSWSSIYGWAATKVMSVSTWDDPCFRFAKLN